MSITASGGVLDFQAIAFQGVIANNVINGTSAMRAGTFLYQ